MNIDYIRTLHEYNFWAHRKVWDCIMQISDEQFTHETGYSIGSIHKQVLHVISVDRRWFARLKGELVPDSPTPQDLPTRKAIRSKWDEEEAKARHYLESLTDADLDRVADYQMQGSMKHEPVWILLTHIVNHGTDHRGQILATLHEVGGPTLGQDLVYWLLGR